MFGDPVGLCADMLHDNPAAGDFIVVDNDKSAGLGDIGGKVKGNGLERLKHAFGHIVPLDLLTIGIGGQFRGIKHRLDTSQPHGNLSRRPVSSCNAFCCTIGCLPSQKILALKCVPTFGAAWPALHISSPGWI